ncbi:MAG: MBL fold metallo-hydrolase [Prevotella sp.]|nr:MBL fold metallo-hydrolase [Bacteroidales bacterium]MCI6103392.1 MBL fold metallo-hydrolase [Bacteroidales bacterium]MDD7705642.1 MBL fold metallo-hydrolase [Bacteroidales bacterium]MDY4951040.1 MBL fold metallo-hydrolase [Prevotella sp.]MDY4954922.1 MBL fold metallo-hydrolase [Prevotella sp.]
MLNIVRFVCNPIQENTYVMSDETNECVIVDCGAFFPEERKAIVDYIRSNHLVPKHLIATHGHIDHNFGNNTMFEEFGLQPEVHADEAQLMDTLPEQAESFCNITLDYEMPAVGRFLSANDKICFGSHTFTILETPGHTPGSVFYYCKEENVAFSGDTLFHNSVGRTDIPGGSMFLLIQSLRAISQLPDETQILPGHGDYTTMGKEQTSNPYLDR